MEFPNQETLSIIPNAKDNSFLSNQLPMTALWTIPKYSAPRPYIALPIIATVNDELLYTVFYVV